MAQVTRMDQQEDPPNPAVSVPSSSTLPPCSGVTLPSEGKKEVMASEAATEPTVDMEMISPEDLSQKRGADFILAASQGNMEGVLMGLSHKVDPNITDKNGQTALIGAAGGGHQLVVQLLVEAGADTTPGDQYDRALALAKKNGHIPIVQLLKQRISFTHIDMRLQTVVGLVNARVGLVNWTKPPSSGR